MYITYERPDHLHDRELDPHAPDADLSPIGETCSKTTNDVAGMEWTCTRRPHTESEHRAAFEYRGDGPQGEVAIAWESNWGEPANRPRITKTITTTITSPEGMKQYLNDDDDDDVRSIERVAWESFDEDDHDELTVTTAVAEGNAATTALAQFVEAFSADDLAGDLASAMSCIEADAIAAVLRTQGAADAAYRWTRLHAAEDEPVDTHHSPAPLAPVEYVDPMDSLGCDSCQ
ncbi:hypothetical protein [Clavibacter michiganensis]|uniref:hypothetical protein n=1 Tax=Clavibacter michiganensis TaxID=28447 RepID=UPI0006964A6E|nr:hypothetical protein [Clavibacter michiganensis]